jgi:DNA-binding XRE family transcriptional regulator
MFLGVIGKYKLYSTIKIIVNNMLLKDKLIWMRKTSGKTQAQMAKACCASLRTWKNYEQGKYDIPTMRLVAVSIYCCIDLRCILGDFMPKNEVLKEASFEDMSAELKKEESKH